MAEIGVKEHKLKVVEKSNLAGSFWQIKFGKPEGFMYVAGQYISIKVNEKGEHRSYSLASWPEEESLVIVVDVSPGGVGSKYIEKLKVSDEVEILGPIGRFVIGEQQPNEETKGYLFIGTGSGIVPLWSMVNDLLRAKKRGEVRLHWGMKTEDDLFWIKEMEELKKQYANFSYDIVLSRESDGSSWRGCKGHVEDCLLEGDQSYEGWQAYICGNKAMIEEVAEMLQVKKQMETGRIHFEKFY